MQRALLSIHCQDNSLAVVVQLANVIRRPAATHPKSATGQDSVLGLMIITVSPRARCVEQDNWDVVSEVLEGVEGSRKSLRKPQAKRRA